MSDENRSLLDSLFYSLENEIEELNFGDMFHIVADSVLTSFLLFFIAAWIMYICISLGNRGSK